MASAARRGSRAACCHGWAATPPTRGRRRGRRRRRSRDGRLVSHRGDCLAGGREPRAAVVPVLATVPVHDANDRLRADVGDPWRRSTRQRRRGCRSGCGECGLRDRVRQRRQRRRLTAQLSSERRLGAVEGMDLPLDLSGAHLRRRIRAQLRRTQRREGPCDCCHGDREDDEESMCPFHDSKVEAERKAAGHAMRKRWQRIG